MEEPMQRRTRLTMIVMLLLVTGGGVLLIGKGCGCTSAPPGWRTNVPPPPPADLMAGAWEGAWASDSKPIKGALSAKIEKLSQGAYRASFTSQTEFGLTDESMCVFHVTPKEGLWEFEGKENLGLLKGGTYAYKGTVNGEEFVCTYDSTFDKGLFRMHRVQPATVSSPATTTAVR
jgi:hypothetical protein